MIPYAKSALDTSILKTLQRFLVCVVLSKTFSIGKVFNKFGQFSLS